MKKEYVIVFSILLIYLLVPFASALTQCCQWYEGESVYSCQTAPLEYGDCKGIIIDIVQDGQEEVIEERNFPVVGLVKKLYLITAILGIFIIILIILTRQMGRVRRTNDNR